jgi:hypothetical protein
MKTNTTTATTTTTTVSALPTFTLFRALGVSEGKSLEAKRKAIQSAVEYMKAAKLDYAGEQAFKTGCIAAWAGKTATFDAAKNCRDRLNTALKLCPDYVAATAKTAQALKKAEKRGSVEKKAVSKKTAIIKATVVKGKAQSAKQVEPESDVIRSTNIAGDIAASMHRLHEHVQMHLKPSQLTDYNNAQSAFILTVNKILAS